MEEITASASTGHLPEGFEFGQRDRLTRRIKRLIREYPEGLTILKELLQNADDAGASRVDLFFDWRHHAIDRLPDARMAQLMGPSLLVANDAVFTDSDFKAIQEVGLGGKMDKLTQTGRFGVGFNSVYHVTDWPHFISRDRIAFFDPHCSAIPGANHDNPGKGWFLNEAIDSQLFPDLLAAFECAGLPAGITSFRGTIFRFPMRSVASEISDHPFCRSNVDLLMAEMRPALDGLVLFLKHVESIYIHEISANGERRELMSLVTQNVEDVRVARAGILDALSGSAGEILQRLRNESASVLPSASYVHEVEATVEGKPHQVRWRVVNGLFVDPEGRIVTAVENMLRAEEKALPWAGAAARLPNHASEQREPAGDNERHPTGAIYCFLPLPSPTGLPVHLNGFFDLGESRTSPTTNAEGGTHRIRAEWNRALVRYSISRAYARLILALAQDIGEADPLTYYGFWPRTEGLPTLFEELAEQVAIQLAGASVIRAVPSTASAAARWLAPDKVYQLPVEDEAIFEPLAAEGVPLVHPRLPDHVISTLKKAKLNPGRFTPTRLKSVIGTEQPLGVKTEDAPHPCLRRREWVVELLRFCLRCDPKFSLKGMPLALLANGSLQAFGHNPPGWICLAGDREREIFSMFPEWFIEEQFAGDTGLTAADRTTLITATHRWVVDHLPHLPFLLGDEPTKWRPDAETLPNARWLVVLFDYLTDCKGVSGFELKQDDLREINFVPDQFGYLHPAASAETPLLCDPDASESFRAALDRLSVPLVQAPPSLMESIRAFVGAFRDTFIWPLCGRDLIDTLATMPVEQFGGIGNEEDFRELLDFLTGECLSNPKAMWSNDRDAKLRELPLFPLAGGAHSSLTDDVYQPSGFDPPDVVGPVRILQTGRDGAWRVLYDALGVELLDRATLIRTFLLPGYSRLEPADKLRSLTWIRDNFELTLSEIETSEDQRLLKHELRNAPLVHCSDGELRSAGSVYDPRSKIVRDVLGSSAIVPDSAFYATGWSRWLEFFRLLGMVDKPRPEDLLRHLDGLIEKAGANGTATVLPKLRSFYQHVVAHWHDLASQPIPDLHVSFADSLRERAWLPAESNLEVLSAFTAFQIPNDQLYQAAELFLVESGHLVASQTPLLLFTETLTTEVRQGLGIQVNPASETVLAQLDAVLQACESLDAQSSKGADPNRSLRAIYAYIGRTFSVPGKSEPVKRNQPAKPDGNMVRSLYGDRPCLWKSGRLWKPRHTFREPVPFFGRYRVQLNEDRSEIRAAYEIFGQIGIPAVADYIDFLEELACESAGKALSDDDVLHVKRVLSRLANALSENVGDGQEDTVQLKRLPLLTAGGRLAPARDTILCDASWLLPGLDRAAALLVDVAVPVTLARRSGARLLSHAMEELTEPVTISGHPDACEWCEQVQSIVQSPEFRQGVRRLLFAQHEVLVSEELDWLERCQIQVGEHIATKLVLKGRDGEHDRCIGSGSGDYYFDVATCTIFVRDDDSMWLTTNLAKAINSQLAPTPLENQGNLEKILCCVPAHINSTLDKLRVRDLMPEVLSAEDEFNARDDGQEDDNTPNTDEDAADSVDSATIEISPFKPGQVQANTTPGQQRSGHASLAGAGGRGPLSGQDQSPPEREALETDQVPSGPSTGNDKNSSTEPKDGLTQTNQDALPSGGTPSLPDSTLPPGSKATSAKKKYRGGPKRRDRVVTYVVPRLPSGQESGSEAEQVSNMDETEEQFRIELGKLAVTAVCNFELEHGRTPQPKHHSNPGFDVESKDPVTGRTRFIEVKAIYGPWSDRGVAISRTQFLMAQDRGQEYWLYVVECAEDPEQSKVHPIQDPATRVTEFRFDANWRLLAEDAVTVQLDAAVQAPLGGETSVPVAGKWVEVASVGKGEIIEAAPRGALWKLTIRFSDGHEDRVVFDPNRMQLLPNAPTGPIVGGPESA